jgi:hypothetical protein
VIQITDFCLNRLGVLAGDQDADVGGSFEENWMPNADISAFSRILSEIVVWAFSEQGGIGHPTIGRSKDLTGGFLRGS